MPCWERDGVITLIVMRFNAFVLVELRVSTMPKRDALMGIDLGGTKILTSIINPQEDHFLEPQHYPRCKGSEGHSAISRPRSVPSMKHHND
jgi:hypothetical protein